MNILASLVLYKHSFQEIELTLDSLLNEKNIDKLVIVDNGSFCTWLDDYKHYKVDVIRLPDNEGFGAGHNKVFEHYKNQCSYFLICNPDIYYAQGEVDKLFSFCKENLVDLSVHHISKRCITICDKAIASTISTFRTPFSLIIFSQHK